MAETGKFTALYERLSKDDMVVGDSMSIQNQKSMLEKFALENGFSNIRHFSDDGTSGTVFNRPGLNALVEAVKVGMVSTVIFKDQSRLGRDVLEVGLLKRLFEDNGVRYIAASDGLDSAKGFDIMSIFRDVFNEYFVADTSKKIRAVKKAKAEQGRVFSARAPYGYLNAPENRQVWIIDDEAAEIVREVFQRYIAGEGNYQIAQSFNDRELDSPLTHSKKLSGKEPSEHRMYWTGFAISGILGNRAYIGELITYKYTTPSYKNHKQIIRPEEEWCVTKDHHPAIIDMESFEAAARLLGSRRTPNKLGEMGPLNGLLYCVDCGNRLHLARSTNGKSQYFVCKKYRQNSTKREGRNCTRHSVNRAQIEEMVLEDLRRVTAVARTDKEKFTLAVKKSSDKAAEKAIKTKQSALNKADKRIAELDRIIKKLFEDNVSGRLSDERFDKMLKDYEAEQATLIAETETLRAEVEEAKSKAISAERFIALTERYSEITELTAELARTFIEKIVVHEATYSGEVKRKKTSQKIEIHYTHIGEF